MKSSVIVILHRLIADGSAIFRAVFPGLSAIYAAHRFGGSSGPDTGSNQIAYWQRQLAGDLPTLQLFTDHDRPAVQSFRVASEPVRFSPELVRALQTFGRREDVTSFTTLLAAFAVLLHRYTGQDEILVGAPIDPDPDAASDPAVGVVANPLVLRFDLSGDPTFQTVLGRVREVVLGASANRDVPIRQLIELLQPQRSASHTPLFQVMFGLQHVGHATAADRRGPAITPLEVGRGTGQTDLALWLHATGAGDPQGDPLSGVLRYDPDLFEAATAARMVEHFQVVLEGALAQPTGRVSQLPLLTDAERRQVSAWSSQPAIDYPRDRCVHQFFEAQAARTPEAIALIHEGRTRTYAALNQQANQLARYLRAQGVGPDQPVGVCLERSMDLVTSLLGVLKAGGAYVALDPTTHPEHLAYMVRDAGLSLVIGRPEQVRTFVGEAAVICVDPASPEIARHRPENLECHTTPNHLAYTIYTSGTTGRPKGVDVPHRGIVRLVWGLDFLPVHPTDVFLQLSSMSFDLSTLELWYPLLHGARLAIYPPRFESFQDLGRVLERDRVTSLWLTASLFNALIDDYPQALAGVRDLLIGGEALSVPHVKRALQLLPSTRIINGYGPTEATTFTHCYPIPRALSPARRSIPIGRPIGDTEGWILDRYLNPVPIGVPGELYVGGVGLARGYRNQPELTAARFVPHPFDETPGARLYATGDRARYLPDGLVEYLGRSDHQVKVRGFRIELEGIEATLIRQPAVRQALVTCEQDAEDTRLVAYVVLDPVTPCPVSDLRAFLESKLPDYMVPSHFIVLDAMPLTASGKVDRRALPRSERSTVAAGHTDAAPRTPALRSQSCAVDVRAATPTIPRRANRTTARLSFAQQRLWFLHQLDPQSPIYNRPTVLRLTGRLDPDCLFESLEVIVRRHEILRTVFPSVDGEPHARVLAAPELTRLVEDLTTLAEPDRVAASHAVMAKTIAEPFNLAAGPLVRVRLLCLGLDEHLLLLVTHHIIFDGWSSTVFIEELGATYRALSSGEPAPLPDLAIQYGDFAEWQRDQLQGPQLADNLAYWRARLADAPPVSPLGTESSSRSTEAQEATSQVLRVDAALAQEVKRLGRENGATLFMTLLAAFAVLLSRYTDHTDMVCGTAVAGRRHRETQALLGLFVNVLPLRLVLSGDRPFREVLRETRSVVLGALAHQDVPFERLVQELQVARKIGRPPLVQVLFQLRNYPGPRLATCELGISEIDWPGPASEFDVAVEATERENGLECRFRYARGVLPDETVGHFQRLLEEIVTAPDTRVDDLPVLTTAERRQLAEWSEARARASDGRPPETHESLAAGPQSEVEVVLTEFWEQLLSVRPIRPDQDFFELGGHSLLAARLFARIERHFGKRLALSTLFEAPTIRQQAHLLRRDKLGTPGCSLVVVQSNGSRPPLFCMAGVGGNVLTYRDLSKHLGPDQPCYALQSYGLTGPNPVYRGVEDAAASHVEEILGVQPEGAYFLCGTSFGGLIALEIAQQLTARGREVAVVAMFDTYGPGYPKLLPTTNRARRKMYRFVRRLELHTRNVLTLDLKGNAEYIRVKGTILGHRLAGRMRMKLQSLRDPLPQHLRAVEAANVAARYGYHPKPYPGRIILFRASRQPIGIHEDPTLGWDGMAAKGLEIYELPGSHGAIIHEPLVGALAAQLKACLAARVPSPSFAI